MPDVRRIGVLLLAQATRPDLDEDALLREDIREYRPAPSTTPGQNSTNIADLTSGRRTFHKPFAGMHVPLAARYGHDQLSVGLNECAAWRLARFLGPPYSDLVPVTVLRFHATGAQTKLAHAGIVDGWGSLCSEQPGGSLDPAPLRDAALNDAAAFFDAVIAQQDRHYAQYRWDPATRHLGLIDHGFAFARPGDVLNQSVFLARRHADGRAQLTAAELAALRSIKGSARLAGLGEILKANQANALAGRIDRMEATEMLISPGAW